MKLLADENFPPTLISALQKKRQDVKRIQRAAKGVSDVAVWEIAKREKRIIVTFDRDFLDDKKDVYVLFFYFPRKTPEEILPFINGSIEALKRIKRIKTPATAIYSEHGLEIIKG